jgi:hypothetical protein
MITGYDHLLFLFGVMFFLTRFSAIIKFVTAFTAGHTITLIAATFVGIQANYFLVDAVIACTVIYKGFDNLDGFRKYLNVNSPNLLTAVFVFGLIHGFGLSTRLQQLPILGDGFLLRRTGPNCRARRDARRPLVMEAHTRLHEIQRAREFRIDRGRLPPPVDAATRVLPHPISRRIRFPRGYARPLTRPR